MMEINKVGLKYCDSESRHRNGGANCCYAAPEINRLVDSSSKRSHVLNGFHYNHFSFNAARDASLKARLNKRFESIDNDRQEHMIDFLNAIDDKQANTNGILRSIEALVDRNGLSSNMLKSIGEAFKPFGLMSTIGRNVSAIVSSVQNIPTSNHALRSAIDSKHAKTTELLKKVDDKVADQHKLNLEWVKHIGKTGAEANVKLDTIIQLFSQHLVQIANDRQEMQEVSTVARDVSEALAGVDTKLSDIEQDVNLNKCKIAVIDGSVGQLKNGFDENNTAVKRELQEVRRELTQIKEEMVAMRIAIVDILPQKLMEAFKMANESEDSSSNAGSDIEFVDAKQLN